MAPNKNSIEDSQHYFFHCRNCQANRHELLNTISFIQNPSMPPLLYGDPALPEESYGRIFDNVHKCIFKEKRFDAQELVTNFFRKIVDVYRYNRWK